MRQARCTLHAALGTFVLGWGRALEHSSVAGAQRSAGKSVRQSTSTLWDGAWEGCGLCWFAQRSQGRSDWAGWGTADRTLQTGIRIIQYARVWRRTHTGDWCWQLEQLQAGGRATREQRALGLGCWSCACARVCCRQMTRVFARKCGSPQLADGRPALHQEFQESGPVAPASASVPCAPALSERRHIDYSLAIARQFIGTSRFFRLQRTSTPFTCSASSLQQQQAMPCHTLPQTPQNTAWRLAVVDCRLPSRLESSA